MQSFALSFDVLPDGRPGSISGIAALLDDAFARQLTATTALLGPSIAPEQGEAPLPDQPEPTSGNVSTSPDPTGTVLPDCGTLLPPVALAAVEPPPPDITAPHPAIANTRPRDVLPQDLYGSPALPEIALPPASTMALPKDVASPSASLIQAGSIPQETAPTAPAEGETASGSGPRQTMPQPSSLAQVPDASVAPATTTAPALAVDLPHAVSPAPGAPAAPSVTRPAGDLASQIGQAIAALDHSALQPARPARIVVENDSLGPVDMRFARTGDAGLHLSVVKPGEELRMLLAESLVLRRQLDAPFPGERADRFGGLRTSTYADSRQTEARDGQNAQEGRGEGQRRDGRHEAGYRRWLNHRSLA